MHKKGYFLRDFNPPAQHTVVLGERSFQRNPDFNYKFIYFCGV